MTENLYPYCCLVNSPNGPRGNGFVGRKDNRSIFYTATHVAKEIRFANILGRQIQMRETTPLEDRDISCLPLSDIDKGILLAEDHAVSLDVTVIGLHPITTSRFEVKAEIIGGCKEDFNHLIINAPDGGLVKGMSGSVVLVNNKAIGILTKGNDNGNQFSYTNLGLVTLFPHLGNIRTQQFNRINR